MSLVMDGSRQSAPATIAPVTLDSHSRCFYCENVVGYYRPVIIFGLKAPEVVGAAHPDCGYFDFRYGQFSLSSGLTLTIPETSFLAHFYQRLIALPGQGESRSLLRRSLASLLPDFPEGLSCLPELLERFKFENREDIAGYPGDLERDFYVFLGQVHQAARTLPLNVQVDFR